MTLFVRTATSFYILYLCVSGMPSLICSGVILFFLITVSVSVPVQAGEILKRNIIVLSFILFYLLFGTLSILLSGGEFISLTVISVKIILIFNIIWFSFRWIGTPGLLKLTGMIPSEKLKLYLILVAKGIYLFRRNSEMIVMQIRSRLEPQGKNRRILARYYIRNMIFREMYSVQYIQASLYSRLPEHITVYAPCETAGIAEYLILFSIAAFILFNRFF